MVKHNIVPCRYIVAGFTVFARRIFDIDQITVDIVVAIGTFFPNFLELPIFLFFMALKARGRKMATFDFKIGKVVLFDGIS